MPVPADISSESYTEIPGAVVYTAFPDASQMNHEDALQLNY